MNKVDFLLQFRVYSGQRKAQRLSALRTSSQLVTGGPGLGERPEQREPFAHESDWCRRDQLALSLLSVHLAYQVFHWKINKPPQLEITT